MYVEIIISLRPHKFVDYMEETETIAHNERQEGKPEQRFKVCLLQEVNIKGCKNTGL